MNEIKESAINEKATGFGEIFTADPAHNSMIQKESQKITNKQKKKGEEEKGATNKVFDSLVERNFSQALW